MGSYTKLIFPVVLAHCAFLSIKATKTEYCHYMGKRYRSTLRKPVVLDTVTCYCDGGSWIACRENEFSDCLPETFRTKRAKFEAKDFVYNLKQTKPESSGLGGTIRPLGVAQLPSLAKQGVSYSLFTIKPCGINLPHVHPRATELLYVIKGSKLVTAFVEENGGRAIVNELSAGQATFFPQGLIHYQQNLGCETAEYISALNSEDPGVVTISTQTLNHLPTTALVDTFNISNLNLLKLQSGLPKGPAQGREECLKKCGMSE